MHAAVKLMEISFCSHWLTILPSTLTPPFHIFPSSPSLLSFLSLRPSYPASAVHLFILCDVTSSHNNPKGHHYCDVMVTRTQANNGHVTSAWLCVQGATIVPLITTNACKISNVCRKLWVQNSCLYNHVTAVRMWAQNIKNSWVTNIFRTEHWLELVYSKCSHLSPSGKTFTD